MRPAEFMEAMGRAVAADSELQAWCAVTLGRKALVLVGTDDRNPPPEAAYPLITFDDVVEARGESTREILYSIDFTVGLINRERVEDGDFRMLSGLPQVVEFKGMVEGAMLRSGLAAAIEFRGEDAPLSIFPTFYGFSTAACSIIKSSRSAMRR